MLLQEESGGVTAESIEEAAVINSNESASVHHDECAHAYPRRLNKLEIWNLSFSVLAWACTSSNINLVVGTSTVVMLAIGGSASTATLPLGAFFFGASVVSLLVTHWLFAKLGRKLGFTVGICISLAGSGLGALSVLARSPSLLVLSLICFGMASGIGFYVRFAAVELVPAHFSSKAVTLVISGGCVAAFAGPEAARGTVDLFPEFSYMGTFLMTAIFNVLNLIFTGLVQFPVFAPTTAERSRSEFVGMLSTRNFIIPVSAASLSWAAMALPMTVVRITMPSVGFSQRDALTVLEVHFLSMYVAGFFSGSLIHKYGARNMCEWSQLGYLLGYLLLGFSNEESLAPWVIGLVFLGASWNVCMSASTVWLVDVYNPDKLRYKNYVQAANDTTVFAVAGGCTLVTSYIEQAAGGELSGWRAVVGLAAGLSTCLLGILVWNRWAVPLPMSTNNSSATDV